MKRDMDLVREILLAMEEDKKEITGDYSSELIVEHQLLMWKAGLIEGIDVSSKDGPGFITQRITWLGYDYLESVREKSAWEKIKETMKKHGLPETINIVKDIAGTIISKKLDKLIKD